MTSEAKIWLDGKCDLDELVCILEDIRSGRRVISSWNILSRTENTPPGIMITTSIPPKSDKGEVVE